MKNKNIIISVIILVVIIIGVVIYNTSHKPVAKTPVRNSTSFNANESLTTSATDTSDTALQNDLNSVDNQLNSLNNDTNNINQTMPQ